MAYLNEAKGKAREGSGTPTASGAPANGTNEVQTLTITGTPTGGTFKLEYKGQRTAAIAYNAAAAAVQSALEALPSIGTGGVTGGGGALPGTPVTITFAGTNTAARAQPLITVVESALTGGTTPAAAVAETTPGVTGTLRDAPIGSQYINSANGKLYAKTAANTWTVVGTQT